MRAIILFIFCLPCFSKEYFSFDYTFKEISKNYTLGEKGLLTVKDNGGPGECKSFNGKLQTRLNKSHKDNLFNIVKKLMNKKNIKNSPDSMTYVKNGEISVFTPSGGNLESYKTFKRKIGLTHLYLKEMEGVKFTVERKSSNLFDVQFTLVGNRTKKLLIPKNLSLVFSSYGVQLGENEKEDKDKFGELTKENPTFSLKIKTHSKIPKKGTLNFSDKSIAHHKSSDGFFDYLNLCDQW